MRRSWVISMTILGVALAASAFASGDESGSIGAGGTVNGDISKAPGETDRIALQLDAGATLEITLRTTFTATVVVTGPDAIPLALALDGRGRRRGSIVVAAGGAHELAISSADGSQGLYTLIAKQKWPRDIPISGTGTQTIAVGAPAGARLACTVEPANGQSGAPEIAGLVDPDGAAMLASPIPMSGRAAKLPPTTASVAGTYHLTIATTDGASRWVGRITRTVPHTAPVALRLKNGLDTISFRDDGVGGVFARHCASCHDWASSYAGVRLYANAARARIVGGSMPPGGGLTATEIGLVKAWIATGRRP
jgi:hypothetical protein